MAIRQTMADKSLHRKLKQLEPYSKPGVNSGGLG